MISLSRLLACFVTATFLSGALWLPAASAAELDRSQIEPIIHDYLLKNPEVIRDAIEELQRREEALQAKASSAAVESNQALLLGSAHQAVIGNSKGDITVVEFFDYNCPYCRKAASDVTTIIGADHNVRVVLKELPILGPDSVEAAQVSIAARMEDGGVRFQDFHEKLLAIHGHANKAAAVEAAKAAGYDPQKIESDLSAGEVKTTIEEVANLATTLNVTGTPTFMIGKEVVAGAVGVDALQKMISKAREECNGQLC